MSIIHYLSCRVWRFMLITVLFAVCIAPENSAAADRTLKETLQMLSEDAAVKYVNPISSAFGSNLNGGWFHAAPKPSKFSFNLEFGLVAMGSVFPKEAKSFSTSGDFRFSEEEAYSMLSNTSYSDSEKERLVGYITGKDYSLNISGATIIGEKDNYITLQFPGDSYQNYTIPDTSIVLPIAGYGDLSKANMLPLAAPQITIGTVMGTQLTFRFLPKTKMNNDLGDFTYWGFGIQHNPEIWLPVALPLNVALGFYTQQMKAGDLFKTNALAFGLNASKQFGMRTLNFTPYAGVMYEKSRMEVSYTYTVDTYAGQYTDNINFTLTGENKARFTLGASVRFLLLNLNIDYNISKYNSATAGLMFAF